MKMYKSLRNVKKDRLILFRVMGSDVALRSPAQILSHAVVVGRTDQSFSDVSNAIVHQRQSRRGSLFLMKPFDNDDNQAYTLRQAVRDNNTATVHNFIRSAYDPNSASSAKMENLLMHYFTTDCHPVAPMTIQTSAFQSAEYPRGLNIDISILSLHFQRFKENG